MCVCACVRSGFARLLEIWFYTMDQLLCGLLYALACKDNFACSCGRNSPHGSKEGRKIVEGDSCVSKHQFIVNDLTDLEARLATVSISIGAQVH
jgi:hypothetical protein